MPQGKIRVNSLNKFLVLCGLVLEELRYPTAREVVFLIGCSQGHAYNYLRALKSLFPENLLQQAKERRQNRYIQETLD